MSHVLPSHGGRAWASGWGRCLAVAGSARRRAWLPHQHRAAMTSARAKTKRAARQWRAKLSYASSCAWRHLLGGWRLPKRGRRQAGVAWGEKERPQEAGMGRRQVTAFVTRCSSAYRRALTANNSLTFVRCKRRAAAAFAPLGISARSCDASLPALSTTAEHCSRSISSTSPCLHALSPPLHVALSLSWRYQRLLRLNTRRSRIDSICQPPAGTGTDNYHLPLTYRLSWREKKNQAAGD